MVPVELCHSEPVVELPLTESCSSAVPNLFASFHAFAASFGAFSNNCNSLHLSGIIWYQVQDQMFSKTSAELDTVPVELPTWNCP